MESAVTRACLGFTAGAIAVLTFHQGLAQVFDLMGIGRMWAFRIAPTWPFGIPALVSLCFWGGAYGAVFALMMPRFRRPLWQLGMILGMLTGLVALFVVVPLKGNPVAHGWMAWPIMRTMLLNGFWGLGLGLILPILRPRPLTRPAPAMQVISARAISARAISA